MPRSPSGQQSAIYRGGGVSAALQRGMECMSEQGEGPRSHTLSTCLCSPIVPARPLTSELAVVDASLPGRRDASPSLLLLQTSHALLL